MGNFKPKLENVFVNKRFTDTKNEFFSEEKIDFTFINDENLNIFINKNYLKTIAEIYLVMPLKHYL